MVDRLCTDEEIDVAVDQPPQTTRARLRGEFIRRAKERKRDYTVDWVHLKLNDQAQRTVLCKDPFKAHDDRVEKLIASLCRQRSVCQRCAVRLPLARVTEVLSVAGRVAAGRCSTTGRGRSSSRTSSGTWRSATRWS